MIEIKIGIERNAPVAELDKVGRGLIAFAEAMRGKAPVGPTSAKAEDRELEAALPDTYTGGRAGEEPESGRATGGYLGAPETKQQIAGENGEALTQCEGAPDLGLPSPPLSDRDDGSNPGDARTDPAPAVVEVDSDGLPWDARIHSGSRARLAKTQQWKPKRGVQPILKAQVEEELRQAMAAPAPVESPPPPAPSSLFPPDATEALGTPPPPATETDVAYPPGTIQTLSELNSAILAAGIQLADVLPAVQEAGLASYALLGTRPDLIPGIAHKLGLGG